MFTARFRPISSVTENKYSMKTEYRWSLNKFNLYAILPRKFSRLLELALMYFPAQVNREDKRITTWTLFIRIRFQMLFWTRRVWSSPSHSISLRPFLILSLSKLFIFLRLSDQSFYAFYTPSWFIHTNKYSPIVMFLNYPIRVRRCLY